MSEQEATTFPSQAPLGEIAEWLEHTALCGLPSQELVGGLAVRLAAPGIPLSRMTAMADTLHPVHAGSMFRWGAGEAGADTLTYGRFAMKEVSAAQHLYTLA